MRLNVWYRKNPTFHPDRIKAREVPDACALVREIEVEDMERGFIEMQAEQWSPRGEMRELIRSKGLTHTSMSVGDIFEFPESGEFFQVDYCGFKRIKPDHTEE